MVCGHSKVNKEKGLLAAVPPLKKTLEKVLFQVKQMLASQGVLTAFYYGNLKHRDLTGDEVASQYPATQLPAPTQAAEEQEEEDGDNGSPSSDESPEKILEDGREGDGDENEIEVASSDGGTDVKPELAADAMDEDALDVE